MSKHNATYGNFDDTIVLIGDIVNIRTWMPRRASLYNYVVIGKPAGSGYEGFIIRKVKGFGGTTAAMHIPWQTITYLEVVGHEEV